LHKEPGSGLQQETEKYGAEPRYNAYQDADQCSAPDALDPSQMK
jgi:hypothetical protein